MNIKDGTLSLTITLTEDQKKEITDQYLDDNPDYLDTKVIEVLKDNVDNDTLHLALMSNSDQGNFLDVVVYMEDLREGSDSTYVDILTYSLEDICIDCQIHNDDKTNAKIRTALIAKLTKITKQLKAIKK